MTPNRKVSVLTFALAAMVLVVAWSLAASAPALITGATWWYFVPAFLLAERALAHVEIREETQTLSLSEAVLLLGLVLLSPHGLIAARLIGSGTALALRRLPLAKLAFNAALFAGEAAIASVFLHLVFRPQSTGPGLWAFAGLSVFLATTFGAGVVACVISFFDSDRPLGLLRGVFQVQIFTATASISLAIVGAAAFARSATNLAYLALLVGGVLTTAEETDFNGSTRFRPAISRPIHRDTGRGNRNKGSGRNIAPRGRSNDAKRARSHLH